MECENTEDSFLLKEGDGADEATFKLKPVIRTITVEPLVFLLAFTFLGTSPVISQYLYSRLAVKYNITDPNSAALIPRSASTSSTGLNQSGAAYVSLQSEVSMWSIAYAMCTGLPAIVVILLLGAHSDRVGRKISITLPVLGGIVNVLILIAVIGLELPLAVILVAGLLIGLSGGAGLFTATSLAYIADISTESNKTIRIIIIDVCAGFGIMLSDILTGIQIKYLGYIFTLLVCLGLYSINLVYIFFLPETIERVKKCDCVNVCNIFTLYLKDDKTERRWKIITVFFLLLTFYIIDLGEFEIKTYYFLNPPLCWNSAEIGLFSRISRLFQGGASFGLLKLTRTRVSDLAICLLGIISAMAYSIALACVTNITTAIIAPLFGVASLVVTPIMQGFCSNLVGANEQGALFASLILVPLLSILLGSFIFNAVYSATLHLFHGFIYLLGALLYTVPLLLLLFLYIGIERQKCKMDH